MHWNSTLKELLGRDLNFKVPQPWGEVTLQDMLVYKSGSSAADISTMVGLPSEITREEIIRRLRFLPETTDFRSANHYSNIMYTVAGHLAERMSGLQWTELVKTLVFDKLRMNTSQFAPEGMTVDGAARPYRFLSLKTPEPFDEQNSSLFNLHPFTPVGSLMVSAEDMTKLLRHFLDNFQDKGNSSRINNLIRDAYHPWVTVTSEHKEGTITHDSEAAVGYGMGWYSSIYRGQRRLMFKGGMYAYSSQIWLFPDAMSAISVSMNGPGSECVHRYLQGIMNYVSDITLHKTQWVTNEIACFCSVGDYDSDDFKERAIPEELKLIKYMAPVEKYIGSYGNGFVGDLNIEPNEAGVLRLKLGRNLEGELTADVSESKLRFVVTSSLLNTEEWAHENTLEFLHSTPQAGDAGDNMLYDKVRIYIKEKLYYEFHRGERFESMLAFAEESDERLIEEISTHNHLDLHSQSPQNESANSNTDYNSEDTDPVKDEAEKHESNHSSNSVHHHEQGNIQSGFQENNRKSSSNLGLDTKRKIHTESLQREKSYDTENQGDDPGREETRKFKSTETGQEKKKSALKGNNAGTNIHTFSIWVFLLTSLNVFSSF